ncbi:MAG: ABC transporter substrate-binding protein [Actinobacteria bacterium]|nr:ABC transporter substrate-binding protein [Actinomycetota bacterium]
MKRKVLSAVIAFGLLLVACNGHAVLVERREGDAQLAGASPKEGGISGGSKGSGGDLVTGGSEAVALGESGAETGPGSSEGPGGSGGSAAAPCATTSNPDEGFTEDTIKLGTIIPLTGSLRPLGEQTARVMKLAVDRINKIDKLPGPYPLVWGCGERPGVFGRKLELKIYSLQNNTPEEALAAMRRLIDVEKVFLVRDCYLESNLMGPATQYQNQKGVPGVWCYFSEMTSSLAPWNYSPGINPNVAAGIETGYLLNKLKKQRLSIIADPSAKNTTVKVVRRIAAHFHHPIPDECVVLKKSQEASNGMRSEVTRIRTCYGAGQSPDAVIALDALNAVFAALEAKSQGWRGADNGVQWDCTGLSCWITSLADLCGDACQGMLTNCASLPCVPWASAAKYPSVANFREFHREYVPQEPEDILTYGPQAITSGIALWLTMTGPDLSRESFIDTISGLRNWSSGIGPTITMAPEDHGDFVTLQSVGVPEELTKT